MFLRFELRPDRGLFFLALAALLALGYAVLLLRGKRRKSPECVTAPQAGKHSIGQALLLSLTALLPILWYVLASNHSYNHAFFTSRALCVTVFGTAVLLSFLATLGACGASGVAGGSLLLIPLACSLFGIPADVAMQVVAIGFIIGIVQDSAETALNSSTDVLFTAAACMARDKA